MTEKYQSEEQNQDTSQEQPPAEISDNKKDDLPQNVAGTLCYILGPITGAIFLLIEKRNKFVRFHAIQSILFSVIAWAINLLIKNSLVSIFFIVLWVMLMVKAYNNEEWQLPLIGKIAKDIVNK